jgi:hypothetical protein
MIDCAEPSPQRKTQSIVGRTAQFVESYDSIQGEACVESEEDNPCELDGSSAYAGSIKECKIACWQAAGADTCHGFTFDSAEEKCTFHTDVADRKRKRKSDLSCYFKKTTYEFNWPVADAPH